MSALRPAEERDAEAVAAIYAPLVAETAISFEVEPPDAGEMRRRIAGTLPALPWLVCEGPQALLGYAYASPHRARAAYRWSLDVSVYVAEPARGRGVGSALYAALLPLLARQGYRRAYAGITLPNPASVRLHEAFGFTPVGIYRGVGFKLGAWHDVGWWECRLAAAEDAPSEPLPFAALRTDPALARTLADAASRLPG